MASDLKYTVTLDTKGVVPMLKITRQQMDDVANSAKKANSHFQRMATICGQMKNINFSAVVDNVRNSMEALTSVLDGAPGTDFQQGLADLQAITGLMGKDLEAISAAARQVGKESGLGARGAVDAFSLLASQISIDQIGMKGLMELQKETITLAQAGGLSLADAATAMAATINQFGLEAEEAARVVNVLAAGSKYGASEVADLAQSFKITGATAAAAGLSVEQTAGALEVLSQSNLKGSEAGTALRNIILKLQTDLGMDLGQTGLANALDALKPKLNDVAYLAKLFGAENIAAAQYLITNANAVREMTTAVTGTSVAQEQAAIRTDTVAEQMKRIQANIDDMKISLFEATNGWVGYASALGDTVVMVSQSIPLLSALKGGLGKVLSAAGGITVAFAMSLPKAFKAASLAIRTNLLVAMLELPRLYTSIAANITAFCKGLTLQKAATLAAAAAQKVLNFAMSTNPVAIVVKALAALAVGLVAAYKHSDRFRALVDRWANGFKSLGRYISEAYNKIKEFFGFGDDTETVSEKIESTTESVKELKEEARGGISLGVSGNLTTIDGLKKKIEQLQEAQSKASLENAVNIEKEIQLYQKKLDAMQLAIAKQASGPLGEARYAAVAAPEVPSLPVPTALTIPVQFDVATLQRSWRECQVLYSDSIKEIEITGRQISGMLTGALTSFASGLGEAIASGSGLEAMQALLSSIMGMLQQFGSALIAAGVASQAFKSLFSNPVLGIVAGAALVTAASAAKAALQNVTALAQGGISYGPTLALVGEYSGARSNPEVIAPLDRLPSLIQPAYSPTDVIRVEGVIRGKDIYVANRRAEHNLNRVR